jgi:glutamate carboxypeptidase
MSVPSHSQLMKFLESRLPTGMDQLESWVRQNSFTANAKGVNALGRSTAEAFRPLGFTAECVPSEHPDYGEHLFLRRQGTSGLAPVVLVTHLDTVFPAEEEAANGFHWRPEPSEGRIYGPGTVDIKGGTLVLWLAMQAMAELAPDEFAARDWLVAANASEEALSADFGSRTAERCAGISGGPARASAVLVFEGGLLRGREFTLVTGRKGKSDYRVAANGRAAHAGSYHAEGRNAIVALSDAVRRLAALTDYSREVTVNVGTIRGGTVVNRVPHEAVCELEMRAFDDRVFAESAAAIEALSGDSPAVAGARLTVARTGNTPAWPGDAGTARLLDLFRQVADDQCASVVPERRGGLSDANYLAGLGPTLDGLGPSGGFAHCSERSADGSKVPEYVETTSFLPKAALVTEVLRRLAAGEFEA